MMNLRRIVLIFLIMTVVSVNFSINIFAVETPTDIAGTKFEPAVVKLLEAGIVTGYSDGSFRPQMIVTRAEMAAFVVRTLGINPSTANATQFLDVPLSHWASKYVASAAGLGIIKGKTTTLFGPDETVTYAEACTMVVRALGYSENSLNGSWPSNYINKASELGLLEEVLVTNNGSASANRGNIAIIIANTYNILNSSVSYTLSNLDTYRYVPSEDNFEKTSQFARNLDNIIHVTFKLNHDILTEDSTVTLQIELRNLNDYYTIDKGLYSITLLKDTSLTEVFIDIPTEELMTFDENLNEYKIVIKSGQQVLKSKEITLYVDYTEELSFLNGTSVKMFGAMWETAEFDTTLEEYSQSLSKRVFNEAIGIKLTLSYDKILKDFYIPISMTWYYNGRDFSNTYVYWYYFEKGSTEEDIYTGLYYTSPTGSSFSPGRYSIKYAIEDVEFLTQGFQVQ